eukprot:TCALIF_12041-PA protein Name:"Similar to Cuticle protein 7 (Blaberus craniifer)" AED:0.09 eAED:0.09 QI:0/0/0/0.5/0.66/0.75/4/0/347
MNALIVLSSVLAAANAGIIASPYAAGLPYAAGYLPYGYNAAPIAYSGAPVAVAPAPIPAAPVSSQYQAQDEFGNLNYGYANINSAKQEVGNAYGGVTGSYSYVDANGIQQRVDYIADDLGFRVRATNLPVAPEHNINAPVYTGVAPEAVEDTAEVAEAKAKFFEAFEEAKNRDKRSVVAPLATAYNTALPYAAPYAAALPYSAGYGYALEYFGLAFRGHAKSCVVLSSVLAVASAGIIATPYTAGLPYGLSPYSTCYLPYAYNGAPIAYNSAPLAVAPAPVPIPAAPVSSQYQAQDEFGNLNYGYVNINSAKQEVGNAYAGVTGSYSYVDANGIPQRVNYIADGLGF